MRKYAHTNYKKTIIEVNLCFVFKSDEVTMIRRGWIEMILTCEATAVPWTGWGTFSSSCIAEVSCISMKIQGVLGSELSVSSISNSACISMLKLFSLGEKGIKGTVFRFTGVTGLLFSYGCLAYSMGRYFPHVFNLIVFFLLAKCLDLRITCILWTLL